MPENSGHHHGSGGNGGHGGKGGFGYERRDMSVRVIAISLAILAVFVIISVVAMKGYLNALWKPDRQQQEPPWRTDVESVPVGPRLTTTPDMGLKELLAAEDSVLTSYGWVHPDSGIVRIPIDRAIAILAERGLPSRAGGGAGASSPTGDPE
jgi:hypothetical protein